MLSYCAHSVNASLFLLLSVSVGCFFFFVNWYSFVLCEYDYFFCVMWCEKDSCSEGITWEVKS